MTQRPRFATIDEYIASAAPEVRSILEEVRRTIREAVPEAVETISYQMPAFRLGKVFIYFAAFRKHLGVYPPLDDAREPARELSPYRGEKGNLKFPLDQPVPYELIGRVATALARQSREESDAKRDAPGA